MIGMPDDKAKGLKLKYSKEDLDKIMDAAHGASLGDLQQLGIEIDKDEFLDAEERMRIREFIRKNLRISKELRKIGGEMIRLGTDDWKMGDKFSDIDLPASEVASMGDDDLRLIPGVTMKKTTYMEAPGHEREVLRGVKFVTLLDVSGSMFDAGQVKERKALALCEETWRICKRLDFDYFLTVFSDTAKVVPRDHQDSFFEDAKYRAGYMFAGGTILSCGLKVFSEDIYKDSNVLIISDMDLGDISSTVDRLNQLAQLTNSFRIILVELKDRSLPEQEQRVKTWFPNGKVEILSFQV